MGGPCLGEDWAETTGVLSPPYAGPHNETELEPRKVKQV